jgi:MEDS: MEthanogen/methylotroph, DcmR Sensory domain
MAPTNRAVKLARSTLNCSCHACAFFHHRDEEYEVLGPFDNKHRAERFRRLGENGIDADAAETSGQLEVRSWEDAYLRGGRFNQQDMLTLIEEILTAGKQQGFGLTRLWANMEWALEDLPGVHDIVEYETRLNYILPKYDDVVVCTYDVTRFSASVVMDIMRSHPQVIVGGVLRETSSTHSRRVPPGAVRPSCTRILRNWLVSVRAEQEPSPCR